MKREDAQDNIVGILEHSTVAAVTLLIRTIYTRSLFFSCFSRMVIYADGFFTLSHRYNVVLQSERGPSSQNGHSQQRTAAYTRLKARRSVSTPVCHNDKEEHKSIGKFLAKINENMAVQLD